MLVFTKEKCIVFDITGAQVAKILRLLRGLYNFVYRLKSSTYIEYVSVITKKLMLYELHTRLRHISPKTTEKIVKSSIIISISLRQTNNKLSMCDACIYGKATQKPIVKERVNA